MAISITDFGAVGDGRTDNRAALQRAFDQARATGEDVYIPEGVFAHSGTLSINGIDVYGAGEGSVLKAAQYGQEALILRGNGASLSNFRIEGSNGSRLTTDESVQILVQSATDFSIENIHIVRSGSAGIKVNNSSGGYIANNVIEETNADSIHMVLGSNNIVVENNRIFHSGDDGISVVSYRGGGMVHDITIRNNEVLENEWGRGIVVGGGANVLIEQNLVDGGAADRAGIYLSAEGEWNTEGVSNVRVTGNTVIDAGGMSTGHGAITVYNSSASAGLRVENVNIDHNEIINPRKMGILVAGNGSISFNEYQNSIQGSRNGGLVDLASNSTITHNAISGSMPNEPTGPQEPGNPSDPTDPPTDPTNPPTDPTDPPPTTGEDTLKFRVSGDSYQGAPQFTVFVDGEQVGGPYAVTASHGAGEWQEITLSGNFGAEAHNVELRFVNDLYDGTGDRNLYVDYMEFNGQRLEAEAADNNASMGTTDPNAAVMLTAGRVAFSVPAAPTEPTDPPTDPTDPPTDPTDPPANGEDTLKLRVSGDDNQGPPEFTVFVDGERAGGPYAVTASHRAGEWQEITLTGNFGAGEHSVEIRYANDLYTGTGDRNLYVDYLEFNGQRLEGEDADNTASQNASDPNAAVMLSNGTLTFSVPAQATEPTEPTEPTDPTEPTNPPAGDLVGTDGADTLTGTDGDETIVGGKGNDTLTGGGGNDTFVIAAGDGSDTITDFAPDADTIRFSGEGMTAANLQMLLSGSDTVLSFDGVADSQVTLKNVKADALGGLSGLIFDGETEPTDSIDVLGPRSQISQVERSDAVTFLNNSNNKTSGLDNSDDVINGQGGHDTLRGLSGNDILRGGTGNDHLYGGDGDDILQGGDGDDRLHGENGVDRLEGGAGRDVLYGGAGTDVFVFEPGWGSDLISGFRAGEDKIDLSAFGFGGLTELQQSATVSSSSHNTMSIDFGDGDRLTIYGIGRLAAEHVIF